VKIATGQLSAFFLPGLLTADLRLLFFLTAAYCQLPTFFLTADFPFGAWNLIM
jgi:hypothetical protein